MSSSMKDIFYHTFPTRALSALFLCLSLALTACNDKYPKANMPDTPLETPLEIIIEPKKVAMTKTWAAGIKDDGTLWTWGSGLSKIRRTTTGNHVDPTPMPVEGINDAVAISGGIGHMLLLRKDGSVWGWGSNHDGYVDPNDDNTLIYQPRKIEGLEDVVDVVAGLGLSAFLNKHGQVYVLGENTAGLYGNPIKQLPKPTQVQGLQDIIKVQANSDYILALDKFGQLYSSSRYIQYLGNDKAETATHENGKTYYPITKLTFPKKVVDFDVSFANIVLLEDGTVWSWGDSSYTGHGQPSTDFVTKPTRISSLSKVVKIDTHSALTQDGNLYTWGLQSFECSSCSNGVRSRYYYSPVLIAQNIDIKQFIDSKNHQGFLDKNGQLWTWGGNKYGTAGTGEVQQGNWTKDEGEALSLKKSLFTTH
ncbi:Cell cycle control protein [Moraxella lacunata]|uniref:Cell cycle control protein n=1 Tax=Moraxella lacunata TaxID=477 RepID=A0A378T4F6_MORLA|nr:hypothetical protein [Moraxella lacunata]STZ55701.1 Cell cycle control protein [Moraxella lacunata]